MKPLIWDAHSCVPLHPDADLNILRRHLAAGFSFVSINVGMDFNPIEQILSVLASFRRQIAESEFMIAAQNTDDVVLANQKGLLAVAFDLEGSRPLLDTPHMVELYSDLGVRQMHLAYNRNNSIAGGCHDIPQGLTKRGKQVVKEINRVGMIMDVTHMSSYAALEVCELSTKPVVYSHANPYALHKHDRNISDEQIKACAQTGGVVCINGVERFLNELTVDSFLEHLFYVVSLVGTQHVGIGLDTLFTQEGIDDFPADVDPKYWWPEPHYSNGIGDLGYLQPEDIVQIQEGLKQAGIDEHEQADILGGNMLRVAKATWNS
ncbi:MAG: peptidase M19 [Proteobacteria bacterium]|nr:peptidase M19 [Pseudomonadota bacterium]